MNQEEQWLLQEKYRGEKTKGFFADCERLAAGEPLAYIIGSMPFLGTTIYLDSHPLIPRVETEFWVEKAIEAIKASNIEEPKVLDLCAGSGCIGVAVAKTIPTSQVDFIELNQAHYSTINRTIEANKIAQNRCHVIISDLFEKLDTEKRYDFILSNPPYIDKDLNRTERSVTAYEPHEALFAEKNGMAIITRIIKEAKQFLTQDGILYIEHEPEQKELIKLEAEASGFVVITHSDQYKVARYSVLRMAKLKQ